MAVLKVLLLKSKVRNPFNSSNYRPIAIAIASSKVVNKAPLHSLVTNLYTLENQFIYKKRDGRDVCLQLFKIIVEYYASTGWPALFLFFKLARHFIG